VVLYVALAKKEDYTYYAKTDVSVLIVYYAPAHHEGDSRVYRFSLRACYALLALRMFYKHQKRAILDSLDYTLRHKA
jgi:hypothetical protein